RIALALRPRCRLVFRRRDLEDPRVELAQLVGEREGQGVLHAQCGGDALRDQRAEIVALDEPAAELGRGRNGSGASTALDQRHLPEHAAGVKLGDRQLFPARHQDGRFATAVFQQVSAARSIAIADEALSLGMRDGPAHGQQQVARLGVEAFEKGLHPEVYQSLMKCRFNRALAWAGSSSNAAWYSRRASWVRPASW